MGSSGANKNLEDKKIKAAIKNFPEDQYTCPECGLVPEIVNINFEDFMLTLECKDHGRQNIKIDDYFEKENNSKFLYRNAQCDYDFKIQKDNMEEPFNYCYECNFNLCGKCSKNHRHKEKNMHKVEVKYKNSKCKHNDEYTKYCQTCKEHLCDKEENEHKDHIILEFVTPTEGEINIIKNKKKNFEEKIKYYHYMIKLFDTIINTYEEQKSNYFHNLNIVNICQNIVNDELNYFTTMAMMK